MIEKELIVLNAEANNWQEAIEICGELLENNNKTTIEYTKAMIENVKTNGMYIVLDQFFAMPHARPESGVLESGVGVVVLKNPVVFGHEENDPVKVLMPICATSAESHLDVISKISELLDDENFIGNIINAKNKDEIINLLK